MATILIIDDEQPIRTSLREILEYEGHSVDEAQDGVDGVIAARKKQYSVIFCDIKMPKMDGLDVLDMLKSKEVDTPVIMISGHGTVETAVQALKKGAFDFIQKPLDLNRILITLKHATEKEELIQETKRLHRKVHNSKSHTIIGGSKEIKEIIKMINTVAATDARVLISGGNGTGKELVARQLHDFSYRKSKPFVEVNCAAIPSELIESELFGHEKGAFTSAIKQRKGKFEQANGGTLFLDEVGDMGADAQAKVLRALQENKITRVGGEKEIKVDVRIVAATNKNLRDEIVKGNFREDLFHRLAVIPIHVPSLNNRRDDIPVLVEHFMKLLSEDHRIEVPVIETSALKMICEANWTGNVRELRNVIERLLILTPAGENISSEIVSKYSHFT
ncbi:MAG: sigma-54-dependent transcriptional regulator [Flavobacteriales bacterium]|jgi:two-component system nitrogen regulation response regulator NtrX|tara:strand:- start:4300 stop:5472 length:1173 start_codon:yes stop_codon:yes gene_type:complete